MVERIFKNWKTSLIGLLLIIGGVSMFFLDKAMLTEAGAFITVSMTLFFVKDGKITKNKD